MKTSSPAPTSTMLTPAQRGVRCRVLEAALEAGSPVRADTVATVLRAGSWLADADPASWESDDLAALAWYGVVAWCHTDAIGVPEDAGSALVWIARVLDADGSIGLVSAVRSVIDTPTVRAIRPRRESA